MRIIYNLGGRKWSLILSYKKRIKSTWSLKKSIKFFKKSFNRLIFIKWSSILLPEFYKISSKNTPYHLPASFNIHISYIVSNAI